MQEIKSYRDLVAWQKAMILVRETYRLTRALPDDERYGLTSQMRRCAVSIPSNMAEGNGRDSSADFLRFLHMSRGSCHELSTQAEICVVLGYSREFQRLVAMAEEVARIINGLIASLKRTAAAPTQTTSGT